MTDTITPNRGAPLPGLHVTLVPSGELKSSLEGVSCVLATALAINEAKALDSDDSTLYAVQYLVEMAKAVIDSLIESNPEVRQ